MPYEDIFGGPGGEIRPLQEPGVCFICEHSPVQETTRIINTNRHFAPGPITKLNGRKYVCEDCAKELGVSIGLIDPAVFAAVEETAAILAEKLAKAEDNAQDSAILLAAAKRIVERDEPAPAPKPKAKKTAPKED